MSGMFIEFAMVLGFISGIALLLGSFEPRYVRVEQRSGKCLRCRYSREGLAGDAACPECGASWQASTIVVKRRTRPSLRAATNIVACVLASVLVLAPVPIMLASLWYGLCRGSGYTHDRAWRLAMHPAEFQEYGRGFDAFEGVWVAVGVALWSATLTQWRFGARAFRRLWACELLLFVVVAIGAVVVAWIGDLRTWTSMAEADFIRNWLVILFPPGVSFALLIPFWRSFRRGEEAVIARLRAEPDGPERLRAL